MYNLDQFYPTLSYWLRNSASNRQPAVVYPYPFGSSDPENVIFDCDYDYPDLVFLLYDQEPVWPRVKFLDYYGELFKEWGSTVVLISTQEWGTNLDYYVKNFNWKHVCYQHHLLACRDWYRGYRNHPQLVSPQQRKLYNHFVCYNRLFAENRPHRVNLLKDLYDDNILCKVDMSFPATDPITNSSYADISGRSDIQFILPLDIDDPNHNNNSFTLDIQSANETAIHIITETIFNIKENYLSEKSYKPIVLKQPFIIFGAPYSLKTLQDLGFKTFANFWDESYDNIEDHDLRYSKAYKIVKDIASMSLNDIQNILIQSTDILEYNYNHFYAQETLDNIVNNLFLDITKAASYVN